MSNSTLPPLQTIALQRALVDALAGRAALPLDPAPAGFKRIAPDGRAALAGRYAVDGLGPTVVKQDGPGLQLQVAGGLVYDMFAVSREVFYVPGTDWWVAFSDTAQGLHLHVQGMYHHASGTRQATE